MRKIIQRLQERDQNEVYELYSIAVPIKSKFDFARFIADHSGIEIVPEETVSIISSTKTAVIYS